MYRGRSVWVYTEEVERVLQSPQWRVLRRRDCIVCEFATPDNEIDADEYHQKSDGDTVDTLH